METKPEQNLHSLNKEMPPFDPETLEYERKAEYLQRKMAELSREIEELETLAAKTAEVSPENVTAGETIVKEKRGPRISRRSFLTGLSGVGLGVAGGIIANKYKVFEHKDSATGIPKPGPAAKEKRPIEETAEEEIQKCLAIIKNEEYGEVLKNPCLTSTLYYSESAITQMNPTQSRTEQIITALYPEISTEFRENYYDLLKRMAVKAEDPSDLNRRHPPLDTLSYGKELRKNHLDAIDLFTQEGAPIYSVTGGIVVLAEDGWQEGRDLSTSSNRGGNTVIIFDPSSESFYRYAHMKDVRVKAGTVLKPGETLGTVGHTGINASKPDHGGHLHLEVNKYDRQRKIVVAEDVFEIKKLLDAIKK